MGETVSIGVAARESGLAPSAIRYYEAAGVLPPAARGDSGYRLYAADDLRRLSFAQKARALGLPLADVRALVALAFDGDCGEYVDDLTERLRARRNDVEQQLAALDALRLELTRLEERARAAQCDDGVATHCAPDGDCCLGSPCGASRAPARGEEETPCNQVANATAASATATAAASIALAIDRRPGMHGPPGAPPRCSGSTNSGAA